MSRMYDRILAQGFVLPEWSKLGMDAQFRAIRTNTLRVIQQAKVFMIDNVAEYTYTQVEKDSWSLDDFPNSAPPFPVFFMETRTPPKALTRVDGQLQLGPFPVDFASWGVLVIGSEITESYPSDQRHSPHQLDSSLVGIQPLSASNLMRPLPEVNVPKWGLSAALFIEERHGHIFGPAAVWEWEVDANGECVRGPNIGGVPQLEGFLDADYWDWLVKTWSPLFYPVFLAISFLHCKNVKVERESPPQKLSRAFQRRHGHPLTQFHTLQITPMRKVLEREGQSESLGLKKALHICRGHFKTFTPDRKLFGRHTGTYWWDAHVRGTTEQGIALKDYQVNQPAVTSPAAHPEMSLALPGNAGELS